MVPGVQWTLPERWLKPDFPLALILVFLLAIPS